MDYVVTDIELSNPLQPEKTPVGVKARADTGSLMLCLPPAVVQELDLAIDSMRDIVLADGRGANVPYVGPVRVHFGDRSCFVGALGMGDEVILGTVPMEDLDLVVNPKLGRVTVDPASPDMPRCRV